MPVALGRRPTANLPRGWLIVAVVCFAGCTPLQPLPNDLASRVELDDVPFFAQADYQCGPAALATVLQYAGIDVTPEALVPMVYLPERKGSLQTELTAATRRFDRVPYPVPERLDALAREVQAGRPVLVLQNLGLRHWPQWHFAVVVGFDREREELVLRSGTQRRLVTSLRTFARTWQRSSAWSMVALRPNELPERPDAQRYMTAAAGLEAVGRLDTAQVAYETARTAWPDSSWPLLGLANLAAMREQYQLAEALYRQLIAREPDNLTASYNLADTLVERGCPTAAKKELSAALTLNAASPLRQRLQARLDELNAKPVTDRPGCAL